MNEFGKVAGYKINIEISEAFFYINKKKKPEKISKSILFTIGSNTIKCSGINLIKE